jgi:CubicO group peptidase (beta-lactamase class C family)
MRILKYLGLGLLSLLALAFLALYLHDPLLATRAAGLVVGRSASDILDVVDGGTAATLPVAASGQETIPKAALDAAIAYGAATKSHALLVWQGGALQLEHYYPGYSASTITPTQSMHKSVLALMLGLAVRDGFIQSLDDPASKYLEEWRSGGREQITIRQMMQQSSGIDFGSFVDVLELTMGGNIAPLALERPVAEAPLLRFNYNNVNPAVLGILIQRATGKPYAQYLSEVLWQPMGTDDAAVNIDSEETRIPRTFCCLDATARSWLQVGLLHLNGGRVGNRQVVPEAYMKEVITPAPTTPNYGLFTWLGGTWEKDRRYNQRSSATALQSEPYRARDVIYFDGFGAQRVYIIPSSDMVIVRTGDINLDWDDAKLPNLLSK